MGYTTRELSAATLSDFSELARKQGGCWCIYYQRPRPLRGLSAAEWAKKNQRDKTALVRKRKAHAILVYDKGSPIGWCQYGPSDELPRIDAGRNYKRAAAPVPSGQLWRITCFFVDRNFRGRNVAKAALKAALASISRQGGGTVEAYPVVSPKMAAVPEWRWFGTPSMFEKEGFRKVAPLGTSGVLMRKEVGPASRRTG